MGYRLYREIRDTDLDWGPVERLVALMIADDASDTTRLSFLPVEELARRTGLSLQGVSKALKRLSSRGYEFRIAITTDKAGRPVFACRGKRTNFKVPELPESPYRSTAIKARTDRLPLAESPSISTQSPYRSTALSPQSPQKPLQALPVVVSLTAPHETPPNGVPRSREEIIRQLVDDYADHKITKEEKQAAIKALEVS